MASLNNKFPGIDFGTKNISVEAGQCADDKTTYTLTLTAIPEVNGDHTVSIDLTPTENKVAWYYVNSGSDIPLFKTASFLFTSTVTTYTLKAKTVATHSDILGTDDLFAEPMPYSVGAIYAPAWAGGYGKIKCNISKNPIKCPTITVLTALETICPAPPDICALGHDLAYLPIDTGSSCDTDISAVTIAGSDCHGNFLAYDMIKYNAPNKIWARTHDGATSVANAPFWAIGVDSSFRLQSINVTSVAGARECPSSGDSGSGGGGVVAHSISTTNPGYVSPQTNSSVSGSATGPVGIVGVFSCGATGPEVPPNPTGKPWNVAWPSTTVGPSSMTSWTPSPPAGDGLYSVAWLNQIINITAPIAGTVSFDGSSWSYSGSVLITKACGSATVHITPQGGGSPSGSGTIQDFEDSPPTVNNSTQSVVSLNGLRSGASMEISITATGSRQHFANTVEFSMNATLSVYV